MIGSSADPWAARMMVNGEADAVDLLLFLYKVVSFVLTLNCLLQINFHLEM